MESYFIRLKFNYVEAFPKIGSISLFTVSEHMMRILIPE